MPRRQPPSHAWEPSDPGSPAASPAEAARRLRAAARELGFDPVGLAPARLDAAEAARLLGWVEAGHHGVMDYMAREPARRTDAEALLEGARTVLMVALPHEPERRPDPAAALPAGRGVVSTYARPAFDYHRVVAGRLERLVELVPRLLPGARARRFCDTAPLAERAFARRAGLGFVGKNTQLISRRRGSFLFLGGLVLDRELPHDAPDPIGGCGTCTRCLDACPTGAFAAPYVLDARRCISYLTIEQRGAWPEELRARAGAHVFGCDVCQAVCPWSRKFAAPADPELAPDPERTDPDLAALARRLLAGFKSFARGTPWERPGKRGVLRNLATALGNTGGDRGALEELARHEDPGVADHARWALAQRPPA